MTVQNMRDSAVKVFWVNYDGEAELFGVVPPGGSYTIDTFEASIARPTDAERLTKHHMSSTPSQRVLLGLCMAAQCSSSTCASCRGLQLIPPHLRLLAGPL